ncbi:FkbM family methyltransferase [Pendulispora rubella]|uniref:FkbM family methyltransferase n=1 Tax=Pendulispora rubella TaxID=2741070 RepID=A0ABZ2LC90_9BACT
MVERTVHVGAPLWARVSSQIVRRLPRGRYRAMNWLCRGEPPTFIDVVPGSDRRLIFECDLRNTLAREVYFTGTYEPQATMLIREVLTQGQVFVDVGANWGYFSLLSAGIVGGTGRVVAIEADPRMYRTLARNTALNSFPHLTSVHVAAAAKPGTLTLLGYSEEDTNWGLSRVVKDGGNGNGGKTFEVEAKPIDTILDEQRVDSVDLLKMDIEGAEGFALEGMRRGLASGRYRRIVLELHPDQLREHGQSAGDILRTLRDAGYRGWTIDHSLESLRRVAYGRNVGLRDFMAPLEKDSVTREWPHVLLLADGVEPPPALLR